MATYWENSCSFGLRYVSWYKCLIVSLVFSHLGFWSGNLFLIAPFPDLCLLVPSHGNEDISVRLKRLASSDPAKHGLSSNNKPSHTAASGSNANYIPTRVNGTLVDTTDSAHESQRERLGDRDKDHSTLAAHVVV